MFINISFWRDDAWLFFAGGRRWNNFSRVLFPGGMNRDENTNWQDKLLGGAILNGLIVVAVLAVLFTVATRTSTNTASSTPVGSSTHASRPVPHSMN